MKALGKTALIAIAAASIGATSLAPAFAQPFERGRDTVQHVQGGEARSFRPSHPGSGNYAGRGDLIGTLLLGRSAEATDIAAVRITHQLELTEDQQALLETLRLAALDAQADLEAAREGIAPVSEAEATQPDLVARYAGIVALTTARAEALEAVQPSFDAFVESLSADQLSSLSPRRNPASTAAPAEQPEG